MQKAALNFLYFLLGIVCLSLNSKAEAQVVIGTPNLEFTQACASESFNTYGVSFIFTPESALSPSNQFIVELSDADGNFSNSEILYMSAPGSVSVSPATLNFSLPTYIGGEGYRIKIKSTGPVASSSPSVAFAAYYKLHDTPFSINNLVSTAAYCPNSSYLLTIDNPGVGNNISPLIYPSLTFNWYKETSATNSVFVAEGPTLAVSTDGTYFVETNYGSCTSNSFSNRVTVTEATSGQTTTTTIISSLGNPFCADEGPTTLSTMAGNSYEWSKDGNVIPGATGMTYQTNESGTFSVKVISGECIAYGTIELNNGDFSSNIDVPAVNMLEAGDTLVVTVTTTAINPEFEWYFNEELIPNATTNIYSATQFGDYKVFVYQNSECIAFTESTFEIIQQIDPFPEVENIPNLVSPNGDNVNDNWVIPTKYVVGTNTKITIFSGQGQMVFQTNEYQNDWPQDELNSGPVNSVYYYVIETPDQEIKKGAITIIK